MGTVALHGHREPFTSGSGLLPAGISFEGSGAPSLAIPPFADGLAFTAAQPLPGFFGNAAGDIFLASTAGQLVAWVSGTGLRHYAAP